MSTPAGTAPPHGADGASRGIVDLPAQLRRRARERTFWVVQAGVVAVTVLHVAVEAAALVEHHDGLFGMLTHLPVILYLVPVSYAGFRYGFEGSILTGLWAALLAVPNLFLWHPTDWEWLGELLLIAVVVSIGVLIAVPVEREQRQRRQAEATSRRLALLNELSEILLHTARPDDGIRQVLHRICEVLPLQSVALASWASTTDEPSVEACHSREPTARCTLERALAHADSAASDTEQRALPAGMLALPCPRSDAHAALFVHIKNDQTLSDEDHELLTNVATQIGVATDNAHLHRLNQERLQTYLQQVTSAQEEERRRIARDLHDVATHELLLLCRELDTLADFPPPDEQLPEQVQQLRSRAAGIVEYLRRFSGDLRPTMLDNLGLAPALRWLTTQLSERCGINARFKLHGEPVRLDPDVEVALFRIVQEALRNVERHASATEVTITLRCEDGAVEVDVTDNGCGFAVPDHLDGMLPAGKLGLLGMRERAQLIDGRLQLESQPGAGTRVRVSTATTPPCASDAFDSYVPATPATTDRGILSHTRR